MKQKGTRERDDEKSSSLLMKKIDSDLFDSKDFSRLNPLWCSWLEMTAGRAKSALMYHVKTIYVVSEDLAEKNHFYLRSAARGEHQNIYAFSKYLPVVEESTWRTTARFITTKRNLRLCTSRFTKDR